MLGREKRSSADGEESAAQPKRGCLGRLWRIVRWSGIAVLLLFGCIGFFTVINSLGMAADSSPTPAAVAANSNAIDATAEFTLINTPTFTSTPQPTNTSVPTETPRPGLFASVRNDWATAEAEIDLTNTPQAATRAAERATRDAERTVAAETRNAERMASDETRSAQRTASAETAAAEGATRAVQRTQTATARDATSTVEAATRAAEQATRDAQATVEVAINATSDAVQYARETRIAATEAAQPTATATSTPDTGVADYATAMGEITSNYALAFGTISRQFDRAGQDVSVLFDQDWIIETAAAFVMIQLAGEEARAITPPSRFVEAHAALLEAADHGDAAVDYLTSTV